MSSSASRITPTVYAHSTRAEWGRAVVAEELADRTRYVFENAGERTFMHGPSLIHEVEMPADEREALAKTLLRRRGAAVAAAKRKSSSKAAAEPTITFEVQEAMFLERFPLGFLDPKYLQEERGAPDAAERRLEALCAFAREVLAKDRLDAAIERKAFDEVHAEALKLIVASHRLAFPKPDKPTFERMAPADHERFALALREVLYGTTAYAVRFNAFVKSLGAKGVPWTIATIFAATVHPDAHVLVKGTSSQRQARALGVTEPSAGPPSGATYAKHLAVTHALRERLVAAGHAPRDLFDVYTFAWRTLARRPGAAPPLTVVAAPS